MDVAILRRMQAEPPSDKKASPLIMLEPQPSTESSSKTEVQTKEPLPNVASAPKDKVDEDQRLAPEQKPDEKDPPQK